MLEIIKSKALLIYGGIVLILGAVIKFLLFTNARKDDEIEDLKHEADVHIVESEINSDAKAFAAYMKAKKERDKQLEDATKKAEKERALDDDKEIDFTDFVSVTR
jgi:hypothetical protein